MYRHFFKPIFDFILALTGIVVLIPVWIILVIAILIDDPGPIFFTQKRVGIHKKYFFEHGNYLPSKYLDVGNLLVA